MFEVTQGNVEIPDDLLRDYLRKVNTTGGPQISYMCTEEEFRKMLSLGVDDFSIYSSGRTRSIAEHHRLLPKGFYLSTLKSALAMSKMGRWKRFRTLIFTPSDVHQVGYREYGVLHLGVPNTLRIVSERDPVFLGPGSNFAFVCCRQS